MKKYLFFLVMIFKLANCLEAKISNFDISNNPVSGGLVVFALLNSSSSITLSSTNLTDGSTNVGISPSFQYTFNASVDSSSLSSSNFILTASDNSIVPMNYFVSGTIITLYPKEMLNFSTTYTLKISGIKSTSGAVLSGDISRTFTTTAGNFTNFLNGTTPLNIDSSKYAYYPNGIYHDGKYYVSFTEQSGTDDYDVIVKSYDGSSWTDISNSGANISYTPNAATNSLHPSLYSDGTNLYASWSENSSYPSTYVKKWNGGVSWTFPGTLNTGEYITNGDSVSRYLPTVLNFNSELYVLMNYSNNQKIFKYNSSTNTWSIASSRSTGSVSNYPSWIIYNNKIYIFSFELNGSSTFYQLLVHTFDGTTLKQISSGIQNVNNTNSNFDSQFNDLVASFMPLPKPIVFNNKLYVAWAEGDLYPKIRVKVYNGDDSNPFFTSVDKGGLNYDSTSSYSALIPSLAIYNNRLFASWSETNSSGIRQVRVSAYNGDDASPNWAIRDSNSISNLGLNKDTSQSALNPKLISGASGLILIWNEYSSSSSSYLVWPLKLPY